MILLQRRVRAGLWLGIALGFALALALASTGPAQARVFADAPSDDSRRPLAAAEPLGRALVFLTPTLDGARDGDAYVSGFFAGDCSTILTVAHLRGLAARWTPGRSGVAIYWRAGSGTWRRGPTVILEPPTRGARAAPAPGRAFALAGGAAGLRRDAVRDHLNGDFMAIRLPVAQPGCAPLDVEALSERGLARCDAQELAAMQVLSGAQAEPTLSVACAARAWEGRALWAHACDLTVGASGGALLCRRNGRARAIGLQTARLRLPGVEPTYPPGSPLAAQPQFAPNRAAEVAPNIALRFQPDGPALRALRRLWALPPAP